MPHFNVHVATGQVALWRPASLVGHAIAMLQWQWPGWHPFAHAAPVWVVKDLTWLPYPSPGRWIIPGVYVVDALGSGLVPNQLQAWVRSGASIVVRDVPPAVRRSVSGAVLEERALAWFSSQIGRVKYDHLRLLRFLYRCPLGWRPQKETGAAVLRSTVCSAWTSRTTWELFEHDDVPDYRRYWTTPSDLAATKELVTVTHELRIL